MCGLIDTYAPLVVRICTDSIAALAAEEEDDEDEESGSGNFLSFFFKKKTTNWMSNIFIIFFLAVKKASQKKNPFGHSSSLRGAAVLTLCKFMLVSESFCEAQLKLLFTVLEREPDESIRTNIIVCLGDLIARHPNAIDPWIGRIFACLEDKVTNRIYFFDFCCE